MNVITQLNQVTRRWLSALVLTLLVASGAWAQTVTVTGTVTDEKNEPLIGASVLVKGTQKGAVTDLDGKFTLSGVSKNATVVVSYVGYSAKEVAIAGQSKLSIKLGADATELEAYVHTSYGRTKKSSFTGAAAAVDTRKLEKSQSSDVTKSLEGMVPGLSITSTSGQPGTATTISLRGIGSLNASSEPLIIVDGAPFGGNLNQINPRDIQDLQVLKDAASSALYGARGANGVIIITTKSGRVGQLQVEFDARYGINSRGVAEYDIIKDPGVYYQQVWRSLRNQQVYGNKKTADEANAWASANLIPQLGYNIYRNVANDAVVGTNGQLASGAQIRFEDLASFNDWEGEALQPKARQEYNLSLSRGTDKTTTFFSLGYLNDKGYVRNTNFERISSRFAFSNEFTPWLKLNAGTRFAYTTQNGISEGGNFSNVNSWARFIAPIYPVFRHSADGKILREDGRVVYDDGSESDWSGVRRYATNMNLIGQIDLDKQIRERYALTQTLDVDVKLPYDLVLTLKGSYMLGLNTNTDTRNPLIGDGQAYKGQIIKARNLNQEFNFNQVLSWNKQFGLVGISALVGHENFLNKYHYLGAATRNLLDPASLELSNGALIYSASSYQRDYSIEGYLSQVTLNYNELYYLSGSIRRDGSSVFHPDHRWGTFWSLGGSWRAKNESFLKNVQWVTDLKLRTSYGVQGNDYLYTPDEYRSYRPYADLYEISTDGTNHTINPVYKGNPNITWEKNHNFDIGLEFNLWTGLLKGEIDFFSRTTKDMLFNSPVPSSTGFTSEPMNFGSMRNTGVEFSLESHFIRSKNWNVSVNLNGSTYKNKVLSLPEFLAEDGVTKGNRIVKVAGSIYDYYLVKSAGVDPQTGEELYYAWDNDAKEFKAVTSDKYDSTKASRQLVGSGIPKLAGGFGLSAEAYGFDLSMGFSYRIGGKAYDGIYQSLMSNGSPGNNWHRDILGSWTEENREATLPRLQVGAQNFGMNSDRWLVDASYLSLRNITLGYSLPSSVLEKIKLSGVRFYVVADNLFLLSARKGFDPRNQLSGDISTSVASALRSVSGGVTIRL